MLPDQLLSIFAQSGLVGVVLACCGWYVYQHDKACNEAHAIIREEHAKERESWRLLAADQHREAITASGAVTEALTKNAQALSELSTLFKDRKS